ncbi:MAG: D-2-hydroxyacid dehydrogenase [Candidatus Obscuribacterales bacterium]|nr:D-2-hydroxyacid dehydrogenase [Candidatus Obscuribacterales bacterium]
MPDSYQVLLYSDRTRELDEYAALVEAAQLPVKLSVCRTEEEARASIGDADIVFGVHLNPSVYESAGKLRWIQSMWAGVERLVSAPIPEGVVISKPVGIFGPYISHYVFGNLLAQRINLLGARDLQRLHRWSPYQIELLAGQCMGIAGMGDIGTDIALVAKSFGMDVRGMNRDGRAHRCASQMFSTERVMEFVAELDVLVLMLPSTPSTKGMFDERVLSCLRSNCLLINVGRGALIDDEALIKLLREQRIGGAVLDVFPEEPLPENSAYWDLPNCTVTPHVAGPSLPADIARCFVKNFELFVAGKRLEGQVDRVRGY